MSETIWQKSILFEIVNKNTPWEIIDAFTLSIPPEGIEISEPQRISRTKTFGGLFEEDYGSEAAKITITGNTGGTKIRKIYRRGMGDELMDGKTAIYAFRDRIVRYKTNTKYKDYYNYELRMYDLSSIPSERIIDENGAIVGITADGWVVSLDSFRISRSKERPTFYSYTIELTGIRPLGRYIKKETGQAIPVLSRNQLLSLISNIQGMLNSLKNMFASVRRIANEIDGAIESANSVYDQILSYVQQTGTLIRYPASACKRLLSLVRNVCNLLDPANLESIMGDYWDDFVGDWEEVLDQANNLLSGTAMLVAYGKTQDAASSEVVNIKELLSSVQNMLRSVQDVQENRDIKSNTVSVYGYTTVIIKSTDTLEKLANQFYGNPSYAQLIALYNNLSGDDELKTRIGKTIAIPALIPSASNKENQVYDLDLNNPYGDDIKIDADGNVLVGEHGDFMIVSNVENVIQAINNRLSEELGNRVRLTAYGLLTTVGSSFRNNAPVVYLVSNLKDTVVQDPRISRIGSVSLRGEADKLYYALDVELVGGKTITVKGAI